MRINLVFGVPGGIDASPEALDAMLRPLPPETFWTVTCIGRHHQRMLGLALLRGAPGIRTGLEDVAYLSRGVLAPSNARSGRDGRAASPARSVARSPTPRQARELLAPWLRRRLTPRRSRRRDAIEASAVELFAELGYHATSMRAIAASVGVQPAAIYHWYPSKEAILIRLQDEFMERLTEQRAGVDGATGRSRRCGSPPPSASTSSTTASIRARRSSPTARSAPSRARRATRCSPSATPTSADSSS